MHIRLSFLSCLLLFCVLLLSDAALAIEKHPSERGVGCEAPWGFARVDSTCAHPHTESPDGPETVGPERLFLSILMRTYKSVVSPVGGQRCAMYPSCSGYAQEAINESGAFVGVMIACDRLLRCGNDLHFYRLIRRDGRTLRRDPVPRSRHSCR